MSMNRDIKPLPSKLQDDILNLIYKIKEGQFIAFYPNQGANNDWVAVENRVRGDETVLSRWAPGEGQSELESEEQVSEVAKEVSEGWYKFYEVGTIQDYTKPRWHQHDDNDQSPGDYEMYGPDRLTWADIQESKMPKSELKKIIKSLIREQLGYSHAIIEPQSGKDPIKEANDFHETLSHALASVEEFIDKNRIVVDSNEHQPNEADKYGIREPYMFGGIAYEQKKDAHYKLLQYKGKPTRKYLHVSIYRMPTGRYEVTNYVV